MSDSTLVITAVLVFMGGLFVLALWVERLVTRGKNPGDHPWVYALSLGIYCTAWTYYGSIGFAAASGILFLAIYIGPTLAVIFWGTILRRLIRLKDVYRVTSIADLVSIRYGRSRRIAALVAVAALVGILPYIALQLKAVISTYGLMTNGGAAENLSTGTGLFPGVIIVALMIVFTILFGAKRIDATGRHQGMVMAVAVISVVKLVAFLVVGGFIAFHFYDGWGAIFSTSGAQLKLTAMNRMMLSGGSYLTWMSYLVLAMSAILFLPRQFHLAVVENFRESHLKTAVWLLPLYMLLINILVIPIAVTGLAQGRPIGEADTFLLRIPLENGSRGLALLAFLGGFSAAVAMVMICSTTLATMVTNHLVMPLTIVFPFLAFLRRYLLQCRWVVVALVIAFGYWFTFLLGDGNRLANMGIISFGAVLQFGPALIGGMFWQRANKWGALTGMTAGFTIWAYTMLLPAFIKGGWIGETFWENGPWKMTFLMPEHLFGVTVFDPVTNTVFWSMFFNITLFIVGSYWYRPTEHDDRLASEFLGIMSPRQLQLESSADKAVVSMPEKRSHFEQVLVQFLPAQHATTIVDECIQRMKLTGLEQISVIQLAELNTEVERTLSGSIGAAAAHWAMKRQAVFAPGEAKALAAEYADILTQLKIAPDELKRKIDYYREREVLLERQAREMAGKVEELEREIAHRKKVEASLAQSEETLKGIFDHTVQFIGLITLEGVFREVNQSALKVVAARKEDVIGQYIWDTPWWFNTPGAPDQLHQAVQTAAAGHFVNYETNITTPDGITLTLDFSLKPVKDSEGHVVFLIPEGRDITARKRAEEMLKVSRQQLFDIIDFLPDATFVIDQNRTIIAWNKAMVKMTGVDSSDMLGQGNFAYSQPIYGERRPMLIDLIWTFDQETASRYEYVKNVGETLFAEMFVPYLHDGAGAHIWVTASPLYNRQGELVGAIESLRDMTEHKYIEKALRESEERYRMVLESNPDPCVLYDMDRHAVYFNPAFTRVFGWTIEECQGKRMDFYIPPECLSESLYFFEKLASGLNFHDFKTRRYTKDGRTLDVSISASAYPGHDGHSWGSVVNLRDITEQKKMEARLQQSQKMEALGTLAGGIAHDFNNILGAILGYTELALLHQPLDDRLKSHLEQVIAAGDRARDLVRHILSFSRQTEQEIKPLAIGSLVKEALKMLRASLPSTIEIKQSIPADLPTILGDPTQVHQIIMNLCTNSAQAMNDDGGRLSIILNEIEISPVDAQVNPDLAPGRYVQLSVSDTGMGIPAGIRDRIFDPYFTTKAAGVGTGLGLSTVHGIVKSYGGVINVYSEPDRGSSFHVYLPAAEEAEALDHEISGPWETGTERIILVDDEKALVDMEQEILERLGYRVNPFTNGLEALEAFTADPDRYDLVITDQTMPKITGLDLAQELLKVRPGLPIILCTGYSAVLTSEKVHTSGIRATLMKPLLIKQIARAIRQVLDEPA